MMYLVLAYHHLEYNIEYDITCDAINPIVMMQMMLGNFKKDIHAYIHIHIYIHSHTCIHIYTTQMYDDF